MLAIAPGSPTQECERSPVDIAALTHDCPPLPLLPQDLVLLPNATTGLNAVITSMAKQLQPSDAVFSLDVGWVVVSLRRCAVLC